MFTGFVIVKEISLEQAAELIGKSPDALRMMCNTKRGIPGAKRIPWGNRCRWVLTAESLNYLRNNAILPGLDELMKEWEQGLRSGKLTKSRNPASEHTIENYCDRGMFYFWKYSEAEKTIASINYANIEKAILAVPPDLEREIDGYAKKERIYSAMRSLYQLLVLKGIRSKEDRDELSQLRPQRKTKPKIKIVRENHFNDLLTKNLSRDNCRDVDGFYIESMKLVLYLMGLCGLRRNEVATLRVEDVDFANQEISAFGKGSKRRRVGAPPEVLEQITHWLENHWHPIMKELHYPHRRLVIQANGEPLKPDSIRSKVRRLGESIGIPCNPHAFRHFFATMHAKRGVPLTMLQVQLGHADLNTTLGYIHPDEQEAIDAFKKPVL